jgi:hypothetical protein
LPAGSTLVGRASGFPGPLAGRARASRCPCPSRRRRPAADAPLGRRRPPAHAVVDMVPSCVPLIFDSRCARPRPTTITLPSGAQAQHVGWLAP